MLSRGDDARLYRRTTPQPPSHPLHDLPPIFQNSNRNSGGGGGSSFPNYDDDPLIGELPSKYANLKNLLQSKGLSKSETPTDFSNFKCSLLILTPNIPFPKRANLSLPIHVGRSSTATKTPSIDNAIFSSNYLSRQHAIIKEEYNNVWIEDLNSCNGTMLNGSLLKAKIPHILTNNDIIQFGAEDEKATNGSVVVQIKIESTKKRTTELPFLINSSSEPSPILSSKHQKASKPTTPNPNPNQILNEKVNAINAALNQLILTFIRQRSQSKITMETSYCKGRIGEDVCDEWEKDWKDEERSLLSILNDIESMIGDNNSHISSFEDGKTIFDNPSLSSALRIIKVYEYCFCILAFILVIFIAKK